MQPTIRLESASIHNFIKHEVLPQGFVERMEGVALSYDSSSGIFLPDFSDLDVSPASLGRGLVIFDDSYVGDRFLIDLEKEQESKVEVIGASSYDVIYTTGGIANTDSDPTEISFDWHYVSVLDAWPGVTPPALPIVAIDLERTFSSGYQLGGGKKRNREIAIEIFASSIAERNDITDFLEVFLSDRTITIRDFSKGGYLKYDGKFNDSFNREPVSISPLYITNVSVTFLGSNLNWDHLNKYRSRIVLTYHVLDS